MKKSLRILGLLLISLFIFSISSCREKSPAEKVEDGIEDVGDEIEDGAEDVKDEVEDATDDN